MTLTDTMTLYRGGREIRLLFLGRGHTGGDVVVYLPKERVVATGDLLTAGPSYLGDAFLTDWIATLDRLRALDFDTVLPGHGEAFQGKAKIDHFQSYLEDFWQQAKALHDAGVSAEEAARRIDLRSHAADYPDAAGRRRAQPRRLPRLRSARGTHSVTARTPARGPPGVEKAETREDRDLERQRHPRPAGASCSRGWPPSSPDIVCLQEIKASLDQLPFELRDVEGYWATGTARRATRASALLVSKSLAVVAPVCSTSRPSTSSSASRRRTSLVGEGRR